MYLKGAVGEESFVVDKAAGKYRMLFQYGSNIDIATSFVERCVLRSLVGCMLKAGVACAWRAFIRIVSSGLMFPFVVIPFRQSRCCLCCIFCSAVLFVLEDTGRVASLDLEGMWCTGPCGRFERHRTPAALA